MLVLVVDEVEVEELEVVVTLVVGALVVVAGVVVDAVSTFLQLRGLAAKPDDSPIIRITPSPAAKPAATASLDNPMVFIILSKPNLTES